MRNTIWDKRIPTLLGIGIIAIGLFLTTALIRSGIVFQGRATALDIPKDVKIANITDTSFTVSYKTEALVLGALTFGKDQRLGTVVSDDRDTEAARPRLLHYITVRNLEPSTKYFFAIISNGVSYYDEALGNTPFEVATGATIAKELPNYQPLVGNIMLPDGSSPDEFIVYATSENAQTLSTLGKTDGSYILPINGLRTSTFASYAKLHEASRMHLLILSPTLTASATFFVNQGNPVPAITLSKNYDFTIDTKTTTIATESAKDSLGFPSFASAEKSVSVPKIVMPQQNERFIDEQPLFEGTAQPGETVQVTIHSQESIQAEVRADRSGRWSFRPKQKLSSGEHSIVIVTKDKFGILKTITQRFTVYAQGSQVNQSATPSATPTLTLATPTPLLGGLTPTQIPSPTQPIELPSPTPPLGGITTPTPFPPQPTPLQPGEATLQTLGITALATAAIGAILFLLTQGGAL